MQKACQEWIILSTDGTRKTGWPSLHWAMTTCGPRATHGTGRQCTRTAAPIRVSRRRGRLLFVLLGFLGDDGLCRQDHARDALGILHGDARHLGRVDDARLEHVHVAVADHVVA